jgi:DNA-binding LacI/PurR family transcriptional regulator
MFEYANKKKVTLADVAKLAGVSKTAASKALLGSNGKTIKVGVETVLRIKKAAEELKYVPNNVARNLATNRSGVIGYILSDSIKEGFNNSYFNRYLAGVEQCCREKGYGLYIARAELSDIRNIIFPEKMKQKSVDGIIATGTIPDEVANELQKYAVPIIFLNRDFDYEKTFPTFCADAMDGLKKATEYAILNNHKNFWFCRPFDKADHFIEKFKQLKKTIRRKNPDFRICTTDFLEISPYDEAVFALRLLDRWKKLSSEDRPDFIFGDSKIITAFLGKLAEIGVRCPQDISAMSLSDLEINRYFHPTLSAMDYDFEKIGSESALMMIEYIDKRKLIPPEKYRNDYGARLIERKSVRKLSI